MQNQRVLKKISLLLSIVFFTLSCSENKIDVNQKESKVNFIKNQNKQKKYKLKNINSVQEWLEYDQLLEYIKEINDENFSMFIDNDIFLKKFFNDANKSIPDDLNLPVILSSYA